MPHLRRLPFLFTAALTAVQPAILAAVAPTDATTQITIDGGAARFPVSPSFYGAFYEEINRAGDGGLYAEMIRNRSFEDTVLPERCAYEDGMCISPTGWKQKFPVPESLEGWDLLKPAHAEVALQLDDRELLNSSQLRSLRITIAGAGGEPAGVDNHGFGGIAVEVHKQYHLSLWTKAADNFVEPIVVSLRANDGKVLASAQLDPASAQWSKREVTLESSATDAQASLRIATANTGTWWLDEVSLFPVDTFNHRANGLRPDLANMVAQLRPQFLRFPGGCIVEGFTRETIWHWKNSIGAPVQRKGHYLLWGYRTTMGLGFQEFLQFCEDLHMAPLFVFNCGMTCQGRNCELLPDVQVDQLLQEALDGLEYANGSVETRWGAERAKNGHPAPFNIQYVEIGNENNGPEYEKRYARFYKAIHARYPKIGIVANSPVQSAPVDILDEHYYPDPDFFIAHSDHYDSYSRTGPKIYVGEFAATQRVGHGNLRGAVSEAAFLTGLERNQDIVRMTSYAPLFANYNDHAWTPDAIYFDNHRAFGAPVYQVLKLFAANRGDDVLALSVDTMKRAYSNPGVARTETTGSAEVRGLSVTAEGKTYGPADPQPSTLDSTIHLEAKVADEKGTASLRFRDNRQEADQRDYCIITIGGADRSQLKVRHIVGWVEENLGTATLAQPIEPGRWYSIDLSVSGTEITVSLDGQIVLRAHNRLMPAITAVATRENATHTLIVKLVNTTEAPQAVALSLRGAKMSNSSATISTIMSTNPDDENTFEDPEKVSAHTETLNISDDVFRRTFPADSINVVRISIR